MNQISIDIVSDFFRTYSHLDHLYQLYFKQNRVAVEQKHIIFKEVQTFVRLFPIFLETQGFSAFHEKITARMMRITFENYNDWLGNFKIPTKISSTNDDELSKTFGLPKTFIQSILPLGIQKIEPFLINSMKLRPLYLKRIGKSDPIDGMKKIDDIPEAYRLTKQILDFGDDWFQSHDFLVQDISGQVATMLVNPKPNELVMDACAGNGGKTIGLSVSMKGKGTIVAVAVSEKQKKTLRQRANEYRCFNVKQVSIESPELNELKNSCDVVWVDAPCSGTGVIRRNPDIIYRLKPTEISKLIDEQLSLLSFYQNFVKPGGRLIYSTCSILPQENLEVWSQFLSKQTEYSPLNFNSGISFHKLSLPADQPNYQFGTDVLPGADGFFITGAVKK